MLRRIRGDFRAANSHSPHLNSQEKEKVAIIGSGNWGSAIARIVGDNAAKYSEFATTVEMYTYEEDVRTTLSVLKNKIKRASSCVF